MVCLGLKPRASRWKAQTNPLNYGDTPSTNLMILLLVSVALLNCVQKRIAKCL